MVKTVLTITTILLVAITILGILFYSNKSHRDLSEGWHLYKIPKIENPRQVIWYQDNLLLVLDQEVVKFNVEDFVMRQYSTIPDSMILGIYRNELVYIEYQNQIITEPTEYATEITITNEEDRIFKKKFHQTIRPLFIENEKLLATDNYVNSPERTYEIDLSSGDISLAEIDSPIIRGDSYIEIIDGEDIFRINKVNNIVSFNINTDKTKIALLDIKGNVWLYFKR